MKATVQLPKISEDEHITDIVQLLLAGKIVSTLIDTDAVAPGKILRFTRRVQQRVSGVTVVVTASTPRLSKVVFSTP